MYPTKYLTASGAVQTCPGRLIALSILAGADAATAIAYDHPDGATGDPVAAIGAGIGLSATFCPAAGIACNSGIYIAITGTTPKVIAVYA